MHLPSYATLFLTIAPLVLGTPIVKRDDQRLDEAVFLTTCFKYVKTNDATPNGRDDKLWYFKNYEESINGKQFDEDYASNPGDKSKPVDWKSGTDANPIKGTLDGKAFNVWGLQEKGDKDTFFTGSRQIRRTLVTTYSTMQSIPFRGEQNYDIKNDRGVQEQVMNAFLGLKNHHKSNAADGEGYKIGSKDYMMTYSVSRMEKDGDPYYEADRIEKVADLVAKQMLPQLWSKDKISDEMAWPSGSKTLAKATHTIPFPKGIKVQVQVADQAMLDWEDRDVVVFTVKKGDECKTESALSIAIKAAFTAVSAATTGGYSAAAAGLGIIIGDSAMSAC